MSAYDFIVIGAGSAGLTAAGFAGKVGKKVALIEKEKVGGDCTWTGCVPSKAILKVGKVAQTIRSARQYGITTSAPEIDMTAVRQYVRAAIQDVYQHETPEVFAEEYNVEMIAGVAKFIDPNTVAVNGQHLSAEKFIITTGARPIVPPIAGLDDVDFFTNLNLFDNDRLPEHLLVIGAGPIGIEMSQAYARLGAKVTVIDRHFLPNDEPDAVQVVKPILEAEGVTHRPQFAKAVRQQGSDITVTLEDDSEINGDMLLVAVGRAPNVENLGLDKAGVAFSSDGIHVNDHLQTNVAHIYAAGDCIKGPKFTHNASNQGSIAMTNALIPLVNMPGHDPVLPHVTFIDPEVAHVGMTEAEARQKYGDKAKVYVHPMVHSDRGVTENDTAGFIKIIYKGGGDLLGATIVAERAGEMITEFSLILKTKLKMRDVVSTMHAYPTYSETVRVAVSFLLIEELLSGTSGKAVKTALRFV